MHSVQEVHARRTRLGSDRKEERHRDRLRGKRWNLGGGGAAARFWLPASRECSTLLLVQCRCARLLGSCVGNSAVSGLVAGHGNSLALPANCFESVWLSSTCTCTLPSLPVDRGYGGPNRPIATRNEGQLAGFRSCRQMPARFADMAIG